MTISRILDELFRILPSKDIGTPAVAEELEIWERELSDLPMEGIGRIAREYIRGDRGEQKDGKFWRPTLPAFRQAVVKHFVPPKRRLLLTDQPHAIPDGERQQILDGYKALGLELSECPDSRSIGEWRRLGGALKGALATRAREIDPKAPFPKLSDEAKAGLSLNERHAG